jgi:hypothetical protein
MGNLAAGSEAIRPSQDGAARGTLAIDPQPLPALVAPRFRIQMWTDRWGNAEEGGAISI